MSRPEVSSRPDATPHPDAPSRGDVPSRTDGFVRTVSERLGGPLGRHAAASGTVTIASRFALFVAAVVYALGAAFHLGCRSSVVGQSVDHFKWMCYSDIGLLYGGRGLLEGNTPYLDTGNYPVLEYPVLTGWFLELERLITVALGGPTGTGLSDAQALQATNLFFNVNVVLLGVFFLIAVWAQVRTTEGRPWDAMLLAASPCVIAAGLVNWDMLPVALTALGCLYWARKKPVAAGILLGLGMAAKLYPVFLLGPLLLLCLRSKRMREFGALVVAFVLAWAVVNLPVMIAAPQEWLSFWTFNSDRTGDFGSIWYVLSLAGYEVPALNLVNAVLLLGLCAGIGALILFAPRRPRFGQVAFLVIAAFLMTNKVYSPQYVLWFLPFLVLARPKWRDWWVFTAGQLLYFGAIWWHLGGFLAPGDDAPDRVYWLSVLVRLATEGWIVAMVVRDVLRPSQDVIRASGADDPSGGVLDGATDAAWVRRLQGAVRGRTGQWSEGTLPEDGERTDGARTGAPVA